MAISHSLPFNLNSCALLIAFIFVIVEQIREMANSARPVLDVLQSLPD
jgi:hypothetical protein